RFTRLPARHPRNITMPRLLCPMLGLLLLTLGCSREPVGDEIGKPKTESAAKQETVTIKPEDVSPELKEAREELQQLISRAKDVANVSRKNADLLKKSERVLNDLLEQEEPTNDKSIELRRLDIQNTRSLIEAAKKADATLQKVAADLTVNMDLVRE